MNLPLKNVKNLKELKPTRTVRRDTVGGTNRDVFYRFKVSSSSNVTFELGGLKREASLKLLTQKGQILANSNQEERLSKKLGGTLQPGNYVLNIKSKRSTPYILKASATPAPPLLFSPPFVSNPGGRVGVSIGSAIDLGNPVGGLALSAKAPGNQTIYYKLNVADNSNFNVIYSGARSSFDINLYRDSNNNGVIDVSEKAQSLTDEPLDSGLYAAIPSGTFYLAIGISGENFAVTPYQLNLSVNPVPSLPSDPGNDVTQALELGALQPGTRTLSSYLGKMDETDWYRFTVGQPKTVQFTYINNTSSGESRLAYTGLFLDSNNNGLVDSGETIRNPDASASLGDFSKTLQPGTYFMRLKQEKQSNYSLNLTTS